MVMRVYVSSSAAAIKPQILAYAEYRIFSALARYAEVREARVVLSSEDPGGAVRCSVTIEDAAGSTRASAKGSQAAAAIDRAAERVTDLMRATADRDAHRAVDRDRPPGAP
jgi:ribosome-associated translation inhibitor RaiA